jgi:hypothetical protein
MTRRKPKLSVGVEQLQQRVASTMGTHYYSKSGVRINSQWWSSLYQDRRYRTIKFDNVTRTRPGFRCETRPDGTVSIPKDQIEVLSIHTTWQGVDDREVKNGPPPLFETRIESADHFWVWVSSDLALAGTIHSIVLGKLREGIAPEAISVDNPYN